MAQRIIGPTIMERLTHVQIVAGVDPLFAGLHEYETTEDGRSYRATAACLYPFHIRGPADRRVTTIVLPTPEPAWNGVHTIVHEYAHALDWSLGRDHNCDPVSDYARTNRDEAFACSFTSWAWGNPLPHQTRPSDRDRALFRSLDRAA